MKKSLVLGGFLLVLGTEAGAQQLSNSDFEQGWEDCYPLANYESPSDTKVGFQPIGWHSANVLQMGVTKELVTKVEEDGNTYVRMENNFVGLGTIGANAPGYLTLGQPWACANTKFSWSGISIVDADGGTYGGAEFTYRPDAISFKYKRSHGSEKTDEPFTVSAYSWNGTFTSDEKVGVPTKDCVMDDRDRVVLGTNPDAISSGKLIASVTEKIDGDASDWTEKIVRLNYNTEYSEEIPTKFNIIFSSADYYGDRNEIGAGNVLCIDDVKLIYDSDLKSLSYDGTPINIDDPENIQIAAKNFDLSKVSCTSGKGADIQKNYDPATRILTITINGEDVSVNSENHHEYSVKIVPPASEVTLTDDRLIKVDMMGTIFPSINSVTISESESKDGTVAFTMKNFTFAGAISVGDVTLTGATLSYAKDGSINITAPEQELSLLGGAIYTKVSLNGNVAVVNGKKELTANVNINWYSGYPSDMSSFMPIQVAVSAIPFNTTLEGKTLKVTGSVAADEAAAVIPTDADVNVVDLTEAALIGDITSSAFAAKNSNTLFYAAEEATLTGDNVVKGSECENFVLNDGQSFNAPEGFSANQITYKRAVASSTDKDEVYTFVLPFTFAADKVNGTVYELAGVYDGVLDFNSIEGSTELKANRPYLVVSKGTELLNNEGLSGEVLATDNLTNEVIGGVAMVGAYEATPIMSDGSASWYGYNAKGEFVKATTGTINPFRAAIKSTGIAPSSYALKLDGTVTGILNLENPNTKVDVYTISGVCVRKNVPAASALNGLSRGVYIVGGQKVVK